MNQHRLKAVLLLLVTLILFSTGVGVWRTSAQGVSSYTGVDFVFLVDQSGSMAGTDSSGPPNDPLGLRFQSLDFALNWLGTYRAVAAPDTRIRMGVIYFGSTVNDSILPNQELVGSTYDEWLTAYDALKGRVSEASFPGNLGGTDFYSAFLAADQAFANMPSLAAGENHLRVVIVLSDGAPCVALLPETTLCDTSQNAGYMQDVQNYALTNFPAPDYRIYAVGINTANSSDSTLETWATYRSDWEQIAPTRTSELKSASEIGPTFVGIFSDIMNTVNGGTSGDIFGEEVPFPDLQNADVVVPPYHQLLQIVVFRTETSEDVSLNITRPDGSVINPDSDPDVTIFGKGAAIEVWRFTDPIPGIWELQTDVASDQLKIYMGLIKVNLSVALNPAPSTDPAVSPYTQYSKIDLTLQLTNNVGTPLPEYPDSIYALTVKVTGDSGGAVTEVPLSKTGTGSFTGTFTPLLSGTYTFTARATSQDIDGNAVELVNQNFQTITVNQAVVDLTTPDRIRRLEGGDFTVSVKSSTGGAVEIDNDLLRFDIQLSGPGQTDAESVEMLPQPDGTFKANAFCTTVGPNNLEVLVTDRTTGRQVDRYSKGVMECIQVQVLSTGLAAPSMDAAIKSSDWWLFTAAPIEVVALITNEDGQPVHPAGDITLTAQFIDDKSKVVATTVLTPSAVPGEYRGEVVLPWFGLGNYTVLVNTTGEPTDDSIFGPNGRTYQVSMRLIINPLAVGIIGLLAVLAIGFVTGTVWAIGSRIRRRQHPCTGKLYIMERQTYADGTETLQSVSPSPYLLDSYESNRIEFGSRDLPLKTQLTRLVIECPNESLHKTKTVLLTSEVAGKPGLRKQPAPVAWVLTRPFGERVDADSGTKYEYLFMKDPEPDQLHPIN